MITVPPPPHKILPCTLLYLCCWLVLLTTSGQEVLAAEVLSTDLIIAEDALKHEEPALAETLVRNILEVDRENPRARRLLGIVLLKKGLPDAAITEFITALQIDPQDELTKEYLFSIYYNRAQLHLEHPLDAPSVRVNLEKAIAIRPDGVMSYYFLGLLNSQEKRDEECIQALMKIVDTVPKNLRQNLHAMLYNSAFKLLSRKQAAEAKDVIPYFSASPQATTNELLLCATISLEIGDDATAVELYDRVLSNDPHHDIALHNREIAQQRLKKKMQKEVEAASLMQKAAEAPPGDNLPKQSTTPVSSES